MKKIFGLLVCLLALVGVSSCGDKQSLSVNNQVKLVSFKEDNKAKMTKNDNRVTDYQFAVLMNSETELDLTITLDNPNDYHIFDFTLSCEDEKAEILVDGEYVLLNSVKSINWKGDTNTSYTISLKISSSDYLNKIAITSMYYSDRSDGTSKETVDLNKKETVDIYRLYDGVSVNVVDYNTYKLELNDSHVDQNSIKVNGKSYLLSEEISCYGSSFEVTYNYQLENNLVYSNGFNYEKEDLYIGYTTYPRLDIKLNPIYVGKNGIKVQAYEDDELIFDQIVKENYVLILEQTKVDGKYSIVVDGIKIF